MQLTNKSPYRDASTNFHIFTIISALCMIGLSLYLTNHYFEVKFPQGLGGASTICDINSFFNCDAATLSPLSNIAGVPISLFGLFMGLFVLAGYAFNNPQLEKSLFFVLILNAVGCLVLFVYSLVALGSLCPMCTLYYLFSFAVVFIFSRYMSFSTPDPMYVGVYGVVLLIMASITWMVVKNKNDNIHKLARALIQEFDGQKKLGTPDFDSEYRMASATEKFADAPIRITKFSDFECPACQMLSSTLHKIAKRFKGKINIQYMFYPLDSNCNPEMKRGLHYNACHAAYLAACLPKKFSKVEFDIFKNQQKLSKTWIEDYAKKENVLDCVNSPKTKEKVVRYISAAKKFGIRSTPTFLLNGVKIEGSFPFNQLALLLDKLLERKK
jgi:uncharacterized membrane protein/thiol-disulfide isomerase/thioredoxin